VIVLTEILITPFASSRFKGGQEIFNDHLKRVFPDLIVIEYPSENTRLSSLGNIFLGICSYGLELPAKAAICDRFFLKLYKKLEPNLVFVNGAFGWYLSLMKVNVPLVNIFHNSFAGHAEYASKNKDIYFYHAKYVYGFFERVSGWNKSAVVSVSNFMRNQIKKYYNLNSVVIPNGVDMNQFFPIPKEEAREELKLPTDQNIGIFVGRPTYSKGFDIMLKLFSLCEDTTFLCISNEEIATRKNNVITKTNVTRKDMCMYYSASDFFILPSRFEGCNYSILEAMACNLPVITSSVGIFYDMDHQLRANCGYILSTYSSLEYKKAIDHLLSSDRIFDTRTFITNNFSFDKFSENYRRLADQLLSAESDLNTKQAFC